MPDEVILGPVFNAVKAVMVANAPLTALLGVKAINGTPAIYDDGEVAVQNATKPYIVVGGGTQVPDNTFGAPGSLRYGYNCTLQIKAVSQGSESGILAIMSKVAAALYEGLDIGIASYNAWCDERVLQPTIITAQAGVVTRESPLILRVKAYDS